MIAEVSTKRMHCQRVISIGLGIPLGILMLMGCHTEPIHLQQDSPFVPQNPQECGVACLQMIFDQNQVIYDPKTLKKEVFVPALGGTTPGLIAQTARKYGGTCRFETGNSYDLANWLDEGMTPIVFWGPESGRVGHFLLVTGNEQFP